MEEIKMHENKDRMNVVILTHHYKISGEIALFPDSRLTDYVVEAKSFIAVINASVETLDGKKVLKSTFLNVQRDSIEVIIPSDLVGPTGGKTEDQP
jgi:hypothetical protein